MDTECFLKYFSVLPGTSWEVQEHHQCITRASDYNHHIPLGTWGVPHHVENSTEKLTTRLGSKPHPKYFCQSFWWFYTYTGYRNTKRIELHYWKPSTGKHETTPLVGTVWQIRWFFFGVFFCFGSLGHWFGWFFFGGTCTPRFRRDSPMAPHF